MVKKQELKDRIVQVIREYWAQIPRMEATREPRQKAWQPQPKEPMDYSNAPVFIILFGDTRTKVGLPIGVRFDPYRSQLIYSASLANTFLYMHLAATTLGLASKWVSGVQVPLVHFLIKALLVIRGELEVSAMIAVGYTVSKPT